MENRSALKKALNMLFLAAALLGSMAAVPGALYAAPQKEEAAVEKKINLNTADFDELVEVRGIGPALAERILEFRKSNGPFKTLEDLTAIPGIGSAKLERIKSQVVV